MEIGKKIRIVREERGFSQEKLAKELGITTRTLQNYEYGKSDVGIILLTQIARILKVDENYFSATPATAHSSKQENFYYIPKLNITASAGGGNELEGLECYESGELMAIDKAFFKTPPSKNIKAIKVDGYSMIPMLMPDSWVIFEETNEFKGDGLYVLNYNNQLMVKLLQLNPFEKLLEIISVNKEYKSYQVRIEENQLALIIKGKVLRSII